MASSTLRALGRRAKGAGSLLDYWERRLRDELKKQGVTLVPQVAANHCGDDDGAPMTLSRGTVRELIAHMQLMRTEIRRFSN
jgi:hypothetical protein